MILILWLFCITFTAFCLRVNAASSGAMYVISAIAVTLGFIASFALPLLYYEREK